MAPTLLTFALLMAVAIGCMVLAVWHRGIAADATVAIAFAVVATLCGVAVVRLLRRMAAR